MSSPTRFGHGLIIGKFYPPHAGHDQLIRAALDQCERVTVEVLGASVESLPAQARASWIRDTHPDARVVSAIDDAPVDFDSPAAWDIHTAVIRGLLDSPVDAVFSSDTYGAELARRLDATWVQIDPSRARIPVSGTSIRADLAAGWPQLAPAVRAGLIARIVVLGAESTGSTTLAKALAEHYSTLWVPEYGREYSAIRPGGPSRPWQSHEFDLIAEHQIAAEHAAARRCPTPILLCDTDVLATTIWHERYVGSSSSTVAARAHAHRPLLYVLTGDEIPFVDDGLRDGRHLRHRMHQRFREVLAAQSVPWLEVHGSVADRVAATIPMIDKACRSAFCFALPLEHRDA